jgi:predicted ATPase
MRFILTGTPGSGKTAILRQLELDGFGVVEEAATDVIALSQARGIDEPWQRPGFTDAIAALQRRRQLAAGRHDGPVFFDRSPICTYALALHLGHPVGNVLAEELKRIGDDRTYEQRVFFIAGQGFVTATPARRISLSEAQRFEELHAEVYRSLGYELISVEPGALDVRVAAVLAQASDAAGTA